MVDDAELLRRYAEEKSEEAFAELVRRRIGLVYSVALRHTHDAHRAEEVTQAVFNALARKAGWLARRPVLLGWLHRSAHYAASDVVRAERRRQRREQEAYLMQQLDQEGSEPDWHQLQPGLDEMLGQLADQDRDAVLLRFFDGQSFAEIGRRSGLSENAARMRVERALRKLHSLLARRGLTSSTTALATALTQQAASAVPAGLAASVTWATLATAAKGVGTAAALMTFMAMNKLPLGIFSLLVVAGTAGFALQRPSASLPFLADAAPLPSQGAATVTNVEPSAGVTAPRLPALADRALELKPSSTAEVSAPAFTPLAAMPVPVVGVLGEVYDLAAVDQAPKVKYRVAPVYPFDLRRAGVSGSVLIGLIVDVSGEVHDLTVLRSTQAEFEAAALASVGKWKFSPGVKGGQAVNTRVQVPIVFSLSQK